MPQHKRKFNVGDLVIVKKSNYTADGPDQGMTAVIDAIQYERASRRNAYLLDFGAEFSFTHNGLAPEFLREYCHYRWYFAHEIELVGQSIPELSDTDFLSLLTPAT